MDALMRKIFLTSLKVNKPAASFVLTSKIGLPSVVPVGNSRFRYLLFSLRSSSLHVPYRITEFATYHNRVRYLYLGAKLKTCRGEVVGAFTTLFNVVSHYNAETRDN